MDGARPHLNIVVPPELEDRFHVVMLPPYCPFFNSVEQAHSCLKSAIKQHLMLPHIQAEILHIQNMWAEAGINQQGQWRANMLLRIGSNALQQITQEKCANWCARIHRGAHHLHLSIEKSFATKSHFINVNKYIVIVNEHYYLNDYTTQFIKVNAHYVRKFWKFL